MNKKTLLFGLILILAASLVYRFQHPYRQKTVPRLIYGGSRKRVFVKKQHPEEAELQKAPEIMLALYSKPPKHHRKVIHNPFFKPMEKKKSDNLAPAVVKSRPDKPATAPGEDPRARVEKELSLFRVFGSYEGGGKHMIFLQRGKDILVVQVGDKIDGKYLIKHIEGHSLDLYAEDIHQDIHIDLSDF
jgi:hypothetical protein